MRKRANNKKLVIDNTEYSLLLYMLLDQEWKKSDYVLLTNNTSLIDNLKTLGCNIIIHTKLYIGGGYIRKMSYLLHLLFNTCRLFFYRNTYSSVYGNDDLFYSLFFRKKNFHVIEDGSINYLPINEIFAHRRTLFSKYIRNKSLYTLLFSYKPFGYDSHISKVFLTHKDNIPIEIKDKVELLDLKSMWQECKYTNELMMLFGLTTELLDRLSQKECSVFFPLDEYDPRKITECELINKYKKEILTNSDTVFIKPHRFDTIDYAKYFDTYLIINKNIPFELFILNNIKFQRLITVYPSSFLSHIDTKTNIKNICDFNTK